MEHINEIANSLNVYFNWNKARISCFTKLLFSLFAVKTINLVELASVFQSNAKQSSRYKRLQRFFRGFDIDFNQIAAFVFNLFLLQNEKWYLVIDRTQWQFGKTVINILMLAVIYKGVAIPIY